MNIAIITTGFPAGGGYVSKAYQQILEKEHNVFIYARGGQLMKGHPDWDHSNVTWAPWHENHIRVNHFIKWLKKKKIDIAFFNEQRYWKPVLAAKKAGVCIGAYIDYYTQETVPAFEIYDFLICNTKRHYSVFDWHPNAYYIPWGTDIEKFKPQKTHKNNVPTFIVSAGWQPKMNKDRRGSLIALNAFNKIKGDCKFLLYTQVEQNKFSKIWKDAINNDNRIEVRAGTFDPFPFTEGDIYLYPSRLDGIGLTLPEAISSGLAAITTDNGPMNEFVKESYNGFLVKVDKFLGRNDGYYWAESICNAELLAEKMQKYINEPNILNEHKINARNFATKNLNWIKNTESLSDIFSDEKNKILIPPSSNIIELLNSLDREMAPSNQYTLMKSVYIFLRNSIRKYFPALFNLLWNKAL